MKTDDAEKDDLKHLESLIRAGQFSAVIKALRQLNTQKIPRHQLAAYANIANRVDFSEFACRILNPIIRRGFELNLSPTDQEKIEYAEALQRLGLVDEAIQLFEEIDEKAHPVKLLRTAFCMFSKWRYSDAVPLLERYLATVDSTVYSSRIARVNLAAALVFERRDDPAFGLLHSLIEETGRNGEKLLHGNCTELLAQLHVYRGELDPVENLIADAVRKDMADSKSKYALFLRKWGAIASSLKLGKAQVDLYQCRAEAVINRDWETIRDCDLYIGHINKDRRLLCRVYFGTPYESFRNRMKELIGEDFVPPEEFLWTFGEHEESEPDHTLDPSKGRFDGTPSGLEVGQIQHRLLIQLCKDLYRPLSVGSAFSGLFPDEHFMQQGAFTRLRQSVRRLRSWLKDSGTGLRIENREGGYRLLGDERCRIRIHQTTVSASGKQLAWSDTKSRIAAPLFTKRDLMKARNCSNATAKRLLSWAVNAGEVEIVNWGTKKKYRILKIA